MHEAPHQDAATHDAPPVAQTPAPSDIGVVVIGRNEGERLVRCLRSLGGSGRIVYVDSGSTDASAARAKELGANVVALDLSRPFTAARARNEGFARLLQIAPDVRWVQFVDGDCEMRDGWLARAAAALGADPSVAVVCGRLRERHPERSVYNRMCDIGWDYPLGEIASCGGVAMYRREAYARARGFNEALAAGEEFEFCTRLGAAGGRVVRIDHEMAWHDVDITRFSQWWKRAVRSGFGWAEAWTLYDAQTGKVPRRRALRALVWGGLAPAAALLGLALAPVFPLAALLTLAVGGVLILNTCRMYLQLRRARRPHRDALPLAVFSTLGKFAEFQGMILYAARRARGQTTRVIEYRGA